MVEGEWRERVMFLFLVFVGFINILIFLNNNFKYNKGSLVFLKEFNRNFGWR